MPKNKYTEVAVTSFLLVACIAAAFFSYTAHRWVIKDAVLEAVQTEPPPVVAGANPSLQKTPTGFWIPVDVLAVHDGDTLTVNVHMPWNVTLSGESVRCLGFDACEVSRGRRTVGEISDVEIVKGKSARDELRKLVAGSTVFIMPETPEGSRDPYGRILAYVMVVKGDKEIRLETWMKEKGYCRAETR